MITLVSSEPLHYCCTNCGYQVVLHDEGRCLFDATRLATKLPQNIAKTSCISLDGAVCTFEDFLRTI